MSILCLELLFRSFNNRREVAAYAGLTPSPFKRRHRPGAGHFQIRQPRLRKMMIQLAWMWIRYQPGSAISRWFAGFAGTKRGRIRRIDRRGRAQAPGCAMAVATQGVVPEGAALKS